jgi:hypothetical protein
MNKFCLILVVLFFSCCSDNDNKDELDKIVNITIGNENFVVNDQIQISSNENCNNVFVSARYNTPKNADLGFRVNFRITKNGILDNITLLNSRESGKEYQTANFNAESTMVIKNFEYNPTTKYLAFEFEGNLFEEDGNLFTLDVPQPQKFIKGNVKIKNVLDKACNAALYLINFETSNLKFYTTASLGTKNLNLPINQHKTDFFSSNGFRITINSDTDLWDLPIGQTNFDTTTIENYFGFEKYIGNLRATQLGWIRPQDWQVYTTSGNYIIQEHVTEYGGQKVTKGVFTMNVYENGNLLYTIDNKKFQVVSY